MKTVHWCGAIIVAVAFSLGAIADDPGSLIWSTYLGGSLGDINQDLVADSNGDIYICGTTQSADFPTTPGAYDTTFNGGTAAEYGGDTWIAKLDGVTGQLIYSTFLGGPGDEEPDGIYVNASGEVIVLGLTASPSFPTTAGAYDTTHNGGSDSFLVKLSADGSTLLFSTFLGGSANEESWEKTRIGLDPDGNIYVTGLTESNDFPTTPGAYDTTHNGPLGVGNASRDVFITKFLPDGSDIVYSTYVGGSDRDQGMSLAVNSAGEAYVTGFTFSSDFPTTPGAYDESPNGERNVFALRLNAEGTSLVYSTVIGGASKDWAWDMVLDGSGDLYVAGATSSADYPTTPGAYQTISTGGDGFITRLSADGSSLVGSTLFGKTGGTGSNIVLSLERDADGNIWIAGETDATMLPTNSLSFLSSYQGGTADAWLAQISPALGSLVYCSYVGGSSDEPEGHVAVDSLGNVYLGGRTKSSNFPLTPGAADSVFGGDGINTGESYMVKIDPGTIQVHYLSLFDQEMQALYSSIGHDYLTADLDGDGLPDRFQMGLVAYVLSVRTHPYSNLVLSLYEQTIAELQGESNYAGQFAPYQHALAALMVTSQDMIALWSAQYALAGVYTSFTISKSPTEVFSGQGDLDGDGVNNQQEYQNVVSIGGDINQFMDSATDPINNGKALPTLDAWALILLAAMIAAAGLYQYRKRSRSGGIA